ncbi:Uncharacterised protein [Mycobacteroides abscessus subsp. abscessus]|nr:Uncharacterised protein [Mycobacteroides abscessus subsp. abscessus]
MFIAVVLTYSRRLVGASTPSEAGVSLSTGT